MTALTDRIAEVLREELSLEDFPGDQLYEGTINPHELAQQIVEELQLDEVRERLRNAVARIYDNSGPSPVLGQIRRAMVLLS